MSTPYELIRRKQTGGEHPPAEIAQLVAGVTDGSIPDYQLAAWLMAVWHRGMSVEETFQLTDRMRASGLTLELDLPRPTADKHSTGGVGDKVSLVLAPLAAELGMSVPMLSGRGLGHTGGTLDKLQSIPGYRIDLSPDEFIAQVRDIGCAITGQTSDIAPADRRMYALRDVTGTVDCIPLIVASILSKKLAAGPMHLVIDLKCGSGAFMRDLDRARELARALIDTGRRAGLEMCALITDMNQPVGRAVGHAVEVVESLDCLSGGGPADLRRLTIELTAQMAALSGLGPVEAMLEAGAASLDDGSARARFLQMVQTQGGDMSSDDPYACLSLAPESEPLRASGDGWVGVMDAEAIGLAALDLGGGRRQQEDVIDHSVGLRVEVQIGDAVRRGDILVRIYTKNEVAAKRCRERLTSAIPLESREVPPGSLVLERVE